MSDRCADVRALGPELALGVATGDERGKALEHLAGCHRCRRELDELTEVGDALLLVGPRAEPPAGFDSRVVERVAGKGTTPPRRRWRRAAAALAAAVLGAAVALGAAFVATGEQRDFAASYRRALEQADGLYFGGLPLVDADGERAGNVFGYEGTPPWVFVVVTSGAGPGTYAVELETRQGEVVSLGSFEVVDGEGSFGTTLPVELFDVSVLRVEERGGPATLTAKAPPPED